MPIYPYFFYSRFIDSFYISLKILFCISFIINVVHLFTNDIHWAGRLISHAHILIYILHIDNLWSHHQIRSIGIDISSTAIRPRENIIDNLTSSDVFNLRAAALVVDLGINGIDGVAVQLLGILTGSLRVTDRNLVIVHLRIAIGCKRNLEVDGWCLGVVIPLSGIAVSGYGIFATSTLCFHHFTILQLSFCIAAEDSSLGIVVLQLPFCLTCCITFYVNMNGKGNLGSSTSQINWNGLCRFLGYLVVLNATHQEHLVAVASSIVWLPDILVGLHIA